MSKRGQYLPAEERREVTVKTVIELAAEQNPAQITTAAIAKRMGLSQGALFRHFPNKDAVLEATMQWVSKRLLSRLKKAEERAHTAKEKLEAVFSAHIAFVAKYPGAPRMLVGELQRPGDTLTKRMVQTLLKNYTERVREIIELGIQEDEFEAQLDAEVAALLFVGTIQGLVLQSLVSGDGKQMQQDAIQVFKLYLRGIQAQQ